MGLQSFDERTPFYAQADIVNATGTTFINLNPGTQGPFRFDQIWATNTDGIDHVVDVWLSGASLTTLIGSVNIPAGQGLAGTPGIELLTTLNSTTPVSGLGDDNTNVLINVEVTVTGANHVYLTCIGGTV